MAAVRDPADLSRRVSGVEAIAVDFNCDTTPEVWMPRLAGIEAVINCAGVLHGGRGQDMLAIHATTPIALFEACQRTGTKRVVQVSAISAEADTAYSRTKKRADDYLCTMPLSWTVIRPSLVYGGGSYGGTSTLRGLAGLPLIAPAIDGGAALFRPIHIDDVVETVARVIESDRFVRRIVEPVGPEALTLGDIVARYRAWLGLAPGWRISVPGWALRSVARVADVAGGGPMGSAGLQQMLAGNAGHEAAGAFAAEIGFAPSAMDDYLSRRPAQTQDLWHARLYFARPLLRVALALMWLVSALAGVLLPSEHYADVAPQSVAWAFSGLDFMIGLALLARWKPRWLAAAQLILVGGYTVGLTLLTPGLWLDPYGGLLKNLPILSAIAIWAVLEEER